MKTRTPPSSAGTRSTGTRSAGTRSAGTRSAGTRSAGTRARMAACALAAALLAAACGPPPAASGQVSADPSKWDFGNVPVGEQVEKTFTVTNAGPAPVSLRKEVRVTLLEGC